MGGDAQLDLGSAGGLLGDAQLWVVILSKVLAVQGFFLVMSIAGGEWDEIRLLTR